MFLNSLLEKHSDNNTAETAVRLLKKLQVPVTSTTIIKQIESHPHFPSLLSISDSLKQWKVDHIALKVEPETLEELPVPFIAHTKEQGGNFILVNSVNGHIEYIDEKGKTRRKKKKHF